MNAVTDDVLPPSTQSSERSWKIQISATSAISAVCVFAAILGARGPALPDVPSPVNATAVTVYARFSIAEAV
jgi:hypothetical protein